MSEQSAALTLRWANQLVEALIAGGVRHAVVSPGSRNTPLVLALREAGVAVQVVLDERCAGFIALGLARASGSPVLLSCTSGSAGAHWFPAVLEASKSGLALVLCTADRPPELQGVGAPQTVDQTHLFGSHVRFFRDLGVPDARAGFGLLATTAAQALQAATGANPGPVHLNLPFRKPLWMPGAQTAGPRPRSVRMVSGPPRVPDSEVSRLADRLAATPRGIIVCGHQEGEHGTALGEAVHNLASQLGWPVIAEPTSGARFGDFDTTGLIAHAEPILRAPVFAAQMVPDLILRIGQDPTNKAVYSWTARHGHRGTITVDPAARWQDPHHVADTLVVADPVWLCRALAAQVPERTASLGWFESWVRAERVASQVLGHHLQTGEWEGRVAAAVATALPPGAWLHVASSMPIRDLDAFAASGAPHRVVTASRGTNGIDGTVATALGQALIVDPMVVLIGDLALLHDLGSLRLAAASGRRLVIVVVDNRGGTIFRHLPVAAHEDAFTELFLTPQEADIPALAQASGLAVHRPTSVEAVAGLLSDALAAGGAHLIHVTVAPEKAHALRAAAVQAVASAVDADREGVIR